jgi:hypothetical protein
MHQSNSILGSNFTSQAFGFCGLPAPEKNHESTELICFCRETKRVERDVGTTVEIDFEASVEQQVKHRYISPDFSDIVLSPSRNPRHRVYTSRRNNKNAHADSIALSMKTHNASSIHFYSPTKISNPLCVVHRPNVNDEDLCNSSGGSSKSCRVALCGRHPSLSIPYSKRCEP